ncbi:MAG: response regulator [Candidatus Scalindua rubra]|uniref:Two component response regulator n=1 Tax=Candidatus Scalindua brodae TaxID=237368 RepID=A0A0B0EMB7_9BACT|nr:MAG: two component response regulator [Candidatus Scalindua brodae]MBZ0109385.1 response regulator [Candidatus Scalindua rubra]TWU34827.1 putative transcriptional regulatory protein TcrX [Candidatus Brocadiaceae bacterium S225]
MHTILWMEGNKNQRLLYEQEFRLEGYDILTAPNGNKALIKIRRQRPDIIIMDVYMPKMGGIEAMGKILNEYRDVPIIIYTAYNNYKDNFMSWAADAYIVKSSDLTELKSKVKELLTDKVDAVKGAL